MKAKPKTKTKTPKGTLPYAITRLTSADRDRIRDHLLALDEGDRCVRFGAPRDDEAIARYVDTMEFDRGGALGAAGPDGALVALAHVAIEGDTAELGISVSQPHRERGLAGALAAAALRLAQDAGAREFRFHYASSNEGMRRLAVKLGMDVNADGSDLVAQRALQDAGAVGEVRPVVPTEAERAALAD